MRVIWVNAVLTGILRAAAQPERNCQSRHRTGEAVPMALVAYEYCGPWAGFYGAARKRSE
ncbi:MAG TPA: hypothetical protein VK752_24020 [Bryobacteraceae bacterium]|nr:hypothetical protein [Bryobacteraceae bacterium]